MIKQVSRIGLSVIVSLVTLLTNAVLMPFQVTALSAPAYPSVEYRSHVQDTGWMEWVRDGETSGTSGRSLRVEAVQMRLANVSGGIEYRTHVENMGWLKYSADGALSGTEGRSLRAEAIEVRLTGEAAELFDVYYRVHVEEVGWLDWAKNGESAGSSGFGYRMEAIQIVLVGKYESPPVSTGRAYIEPEISVQSHVQNIGWQDFVSNGGESGTCGQSLRLEAIRIRLANVIGGIEYRTHVQSIGWMDYVSDGGVSGTQGQSLAVEAAEIRLTGAAAARFDVYYRVHVKDIGWMDWAKNGESAGTTGFGRQMEAIQIVLVGKGGIAPGPTTRPFIKAVPAPEPIPVAEPIPVVSDKPMVALTFDDGPNPAVDTRILNALSAFDGHATFFAAGYRIDEYPDTVLQIYNQGSEIGNHTYSHDRLTDLSASGISSELARTDQLIIDITGVRPGLIRPPEGSYNARVIRSVDRPLVLWSIDTRDWETRSAASTISSVLDNVQDGDIILMHSLYTSTAAACETIIPELAARGYQMVTVSELLAARGVASSAGSVIRSARP